MGKGILERLAEGPVLGDGGYLLELEKRGYVQAGPFTPEVVIDHPEALVALHREFLRAGAEVLQTTTTSATTWCDTLAGRTLRAVGGADMKVGYVVLYVDDVDACARFWVEKVGMVERRRIEAGPFRIVQVGFAEQEFSFELVPLEMMRENPDGLDLATPSIAFRVEDLDATRADLVAHGVQATEVSEARGPRSFAFSDPEGRWFAVLS